jgi:hypothetical protein
MGVSHDRSGKARCRTAFATRVDTYGRHALDKLEELTFRCSRIAQKKHVYICVKAKYAEALMNT